MQVADNARLWIHFRGDAVGVAARHVALRLQFHHLLVEKVGIPLADYNGVGHGGRAVVSSWWLVVGNLCLSASGILHPPSESSHQLPCCTSMRPDLPWVPSLYLRGDSRPRLYLRGDSRPRLSLRGDSRPRLYLRGAAAPGSTCVGTAAPGSTCVGTAALGC